MQSECSHSAPPLALQHQTGPGCALSHPIRIECILADRCEKEQQDGPIDEGPSRPGMRAGLALWVLDVPCFRGRTRRVRSRRDDGVHAHGGQDQRVLISLFGGGAAAHLNLTAVARNFHPTHLAVLILTYRKRQV